MGTRTPRAVCIKKTDDKDIAGQRGVSNAEYIPCHIEPNGFCSNSIKPEKCCHLEQLHSGQLSLR